MTTHDPVSSPQHYTNGSLECIEAIEASMSVEAFKGFLKGNVQKYVWRYEMKGGSESLQKAQWYLSRLVSMAQQEERNQGMPGDIADNSVAGHQSAPTYASTATVECRDGFCPLPSVRQGPFEQMFQPVN